MTIYQVIGDETREVMEKLGLPTVFDSNEETFRNWYLYKDTICIPIVINAKVKEIEDSSTAIDHGRQILTS